MFDVIWNSIYVIWHSYSTHSHAVRNEWCVRCGQIVFIAVCIFMCVYLSTFALLWVLFHCARVYVECMCERKQNVSLSDWNSVAIDRKAIEHTAPLARNRSARNRTYRHTHERSRAHACLLHIYVVRRSDSFCYFQMVRCLSRLERRPEHVFVAWVLLFACVRVRECIMSLYCRFFVRAHTFEMI